MKRILELLALAGPIEMGEWLEKWPLAKVLMGKDYPVVEAIGYREDWRNVDERYPIHPLELEMNDSERVLDLIRCRRDLVVQALVQEIQKVFLLIVGPGVDCAGWRMVRLKGWWMRETVYEQGGMWYVHMDCTLTFEPREVKPDVLAGPVAQAGSSGGKGESAVPAGDGAEVGG